MPTDDPTVSAAPRDGRNARRARGRSASLDAMVDLVSETHQVPNVDQIAARAGVSVASVFRYFPTLEIMYTEAFIHCKVRYASQLAPELPTTGLFEHRLGKFVAARMAQYEIMEPFGRIARSKALDSPAMAAQVNVLRQEHLAQVSAVFAIELEPLTPVTQADVAEQIVVTTSFEGWDHFVRTFGRTPSQLRRIWSNSIRSVFAAV